MGKLRQFLSLPRLQAIGMETPAGTLAGLSNRMAYLQTLRLAGVELTEILTHPPSGFRHPRGHLEIRLAFTSKPLQQAKYLWEAWHGGLHPGDVADLGRAYGLHPLSITLQDRIDPERAVADFRLNQELGRLVKESSIRIPGTLMVDAQYARCDLPEGLALRSLEITAAANIEELPERLWISERLVLRDLPRLRRISRMGDGFDGQVEVRSCPSIDEWPDWPVLKYLRLMDLPWQEWPKGLHFVADLELEQLPCLRRLPRDLQWRRLRAVDCPVLHTVHLPVETEELEEGPWNSHWTELEACPSLVTLIGACSVDGGLRLTNCASLRGLGEGIQSISRDLRLMDCPALEALPDGLHTGGDLYLENTPRLKCLPSGLKVGGRLIWSPHDQNQEPSNTKFPNPCRSGDHRGYCQNRPITECNHAKTLKMKLLNESR